MYIYYVVYGEHARHELNTKNINIINGNNVVIFACLLVFLNHDLQSSKALQWFEDMFDLMNGW